MNATRPVTPGSNVMMPAPGFRRRMGLAGASSRVALASLLVTMTGFAILNSQATDARAGSGCVDVALVLAVDGSGSVDAREFLVISGSNGCGYCTAAHSMIADKMSKVPADVLEALRARKPIADARLAALATFAQTMFDTRRRPTQADLNSFCAAGFSDRQALEIVLALAVNTLSNYSNHLFHTEVDETLAGYKLAPAA